MAPILHPALYIGISAGFDSPLSQIVRELARHNSLGYGWRNLPRKEYPSFQAKIQTSADSIPQLRRPPMPSAVGLTVPTLVASPESYTRAKGCVSWVGRRIQRRPCFTTRVTANQIAKSQYLCAMPLHVTSRLSS